MTTTLVDSQISEAIEQELIAHYQGRLVRNELWFQCVSHEDQNPSASWNSEKGCWHCFVCGAGGGWKDLMSRLGLSFQKDSTTPGRTHSPPRQYIPHFPFDWNKISNEIQFLSEDFFLRSEKVLSAATGHDTSKWTDTDFETASDAVGKAYYDGLLSEALQDLAFNVRAYGLEAEERERHASRR